MTILFSSIVTSARRRLRQPDPMNSNWDNDAMLVYANDALTEIADELGWNRKSTVYTGNGETKYALPEDLLRIESLFDNGTQVPYVTSDAANIFDDTNGANNGPVGYTVRGNFIYILPGLPTNQVRQLFYVARPRPIENENDTIDIPQTLAIPLVFKLVADCFNEIGNTAQADRHYALFNDQLRRRRKMEADRQNPKVSSLGIPRIRY